jgi:hypothetical protein
MNAQLSARHSAVRGVALIPERERPDGPVTTARLRRTVGVYAAAAQRDPDAGVALAAAG